MEAGPAAPDSSQPDDKAAVQLDTDRKLEDASAPSELSAGDSDAAVPMETSIPGEASVENQNQPQSEQPNGTEAVPVGEGLSPEEEAKAAADRQKILEKERLHAEVQARLKQLSQQGFQSCIVAAPACHPGSLLKAVLPLLAPSASFAVYFSAAQPLAECMSVLQVIFSPQPHHIMNHSKSEPIPSLSWVKHCIRPLLPADLEQQNIVSRCFEFGSLLCCVVRDF